MSLRAARADPEFDAFVAASGGRLLQAAVLMVLDRELAADLVQTALLRVAAHWGDGLMSPEAYARTVLANLVRNTWRHRSRRVREVWGTDHEPSDLQPDSADRIAERDALLQALRELSTKQRTVVVLRYFDDKSIAETAQLLGLAEGTVKAVSHHALSKLRSLLDSENSQEGPVSCASI